MQVKVKTKNTLVKVVTLIILQRLNGGQYAILKSDKNKRYIYNLTLLEQTNCGLKFRIKPASKSEVEYVQHNASLAFMARDMPDVAITKLTVPINSIYSKRVIFGMVPYQIKRDIDIEDLDIRFNDPFDGDVTTVFEFAEPVIFSIGIGDSVMAPTAV